MFDDTTCEIPRIIHQTWKGRRVDARFAGHIRSWVDTNPGWKHWFWTDRDNRNLVATRFPSYLKLWDALPQNIMRADLMRYFILWEFGGVYVDLDVEALLPLDRLVEALRQQAGSQSRGRGTVRGGGPGCILGQEPWVHAHVLYNADRLICNAIMMSCPGHPLWRVVVEDSGGAHHSWGREERQQGGVTEVAPRVAPVS